MRIVSGLDALPNQQFSVTLDQNRWVFRINECHGVMAVTLTLNEVEILSGQRIVAGSALIPYRHLQGSGNFLFLTDTDDLPYWDKFGVSQRLAYIAPGETYEA